MEDYDPMEDYYGVLQNEKTIDEYFYGKKRWPRGY
jgi:hypothetical protein